MAAKKPNVMVICGDGAGLPVTASGRSAWKAWWLLMSEEDRLEPPDSNKLAQKRTDLALQRTIIAADRTLMAWVRTSISMIGFGFSIYKFFEYVRQAQDLHSTIRAQAPRRLGLTLIGLGTITLIMAVWQHRLFLKRLGLMWRAYWLSLSVVVALLMALIGVFAFMNVLLRTGPF